MVAQLSIETGIAPQYLIELDSEMIKAMVMVFKDKAKESERVRRSKRH
jgi:hypothetical protein